MDGMMLLGLLLVGMALAGVISAYLMGQHDGRREPRLGLAKSNEPTIDVYFSPHGGCEAALHQIISAARRSIYVMSYYFTDKDLLATLLALRQRGIAVSLLTDDHGDNDPGFALLRAAGAKHWVDKTHKIMHNKVMVVDEVVVVTGSFNFTNAAEKCNAENLLVIHSKTVAAKYLENWQLHQSHAQQELAV